MKRKIIKIDAEKCDGCGLCAEACHESAITIKDGKAALLRDDFCDGLGNCLPVCPTGAITFEEREAADYDEAAVKENAARKSAASGGCPGSRAFSMPGEKPAEKNAPLNTARNANAQSELRQWPVQIKLVPANAPYFKNANLLVAADCAAYARANFHGEFMRGKITVIGCPKLDGVDYAEKLTAIISGNEIKSVTVARMEVPCCGGLERAVAEALKNSGEVIPCRVVTFAPDGEIVEDNGA
jgi:ferredoxin